MKQMKYTSEPNELLVQAWKNISHFNNGGIKKGEIVSLRNLIIFLIGIENIFIKSMGLQDDIQFDGKDRKREHRQFGFFIGCNFFLADPSETRKMCEVYRPLVLTKKQNQRDESRRRKQIAIEKELSRSTINSSRGLTRP
jgi:hypothetical protein